MWSKICSMPFTWAFEAKEETRSSFVLWGLLCFSRPLTECHSAWPAMVSGCQSPGLQAVQGGACGGDAYFHVYGGLCMY